ncbi:MAG: hypothetical protein R3C11_05835 [Planctomycetaceae bacterium]
MTDSNKTRLKDNSNRLTFCMIACGFLGLISGNDLLAQAPNRLPVITSRNFNQPASAASSVQNQPANSGWSTLPAESTESVAPAVIKPQGVGSLILKSSHNQPGLLSESRNSELKQQHGKVSLGELGDPWVNTAHRDALPPAPAVPVFEDQVQSTTAPALLYIAPEADSNLPDEYNYFDSSTSSEILVQDSEVSTPIPSQNSSIFTTLHRDGGTGKPGTQKEGTRDLIAEAFSGNNESVPSDNTPDTEQNAALAEYFEESEEAGVVSISLSEPVAESPQPLKTVSATSSYSNSNSQPMNQSTSRSGDSFDAFEEVFENVSVPGTGRGVSPISYLEDLAEESAEDLPEMQTVSAWFGVNSGGDYADPCAPAPVWEFRAEALYWHRSDPQGGEPLLIRIPDMAAPLLYW